MSQIGVALRLGRLADDLGNYLLVPMDHGVSAGPQVGLIDPALTVRAVVAAGASGVILHKGVVRRVAPELAGSRTGLLVHASASTCRGSSNDDKVLVASVETAVALGADGFSIHVNLGARSEDRMLEQFGASSDACHRLGIPLLAMVYARGPAIEDAADPELVAHAARLAEELGADLVKVTYTGSVSSFRRVVEAVSIPVLIAGGAAMDTPESFLAVAQEAYQAGARGVSVGRNIWQAKSPGGVVRGLGAVFAGEELARAEALL